MSQLKEAFHYANTTILLSTYWICGKVCMLAFLCQILDYFFIIIIIYCYTYSVS